MWTADYCSEYPLQINRIWKNGSEVGKRKRDNVITWECKADLNATQTPVNLIQVALRQQFTTTKPINPNLSIPPACNKSHLHEANTKHSPLPSSYQKTGEKRRDSKRKCVTLWGAFDCIDKLKLALRQPFAQQKQLFTHVSATPEAEPAAKKKKRMKKRNYLTTSYFGGVIPYLRD